jgi:hypothetical protein
MLDFIPVGIVDKSMLVLAGVIAAFCLYRATNRIAALAIVAGLVTHAANQNFIHLQWLYPAIDIVTAAIVVLSCQSKIMQAACWGFIIAVHVLIGVDVVSIFVGGTMIKVSALLSMIWLLHFPIVTGKQ